MALKRVEVIKNEIDVYVAEWQNLSNDFVIQKNRFKKLFQHQPDHFITLGDDKTEILKIIKNIDPQYVHFEEMPEFFVPFDIAKEIYKPDRKYKIFETTHSSDYNVDDKIFFPDKFLFVSQYNCFKFNRLGIPTEVIEFPVEKKQRDPEKKAEAIKKLGLDPKLKHVVNVGLFTPRKNQAYAFDIARKLKDEKIQFHFIGNQADNFQDYWRPLMKIKPKNCKVWGEREDINDFLEACDLFLFTSRGFRWNKELNPLVIKEALEHQIPQFLFPLDVYNRKYDTEDTIHYLNGDLDIDAGLVKNFLFERKAMPWIDKKYKIRAVHLLLEEDNRKSESIKELEKLPLYGIDYVQHINQRYKDNPPRELCARPTEVGRIGAYSLRGPHYGNYLSFRKAIFTEFTDDIDFLMIFESDCKLNVPIQEFVDKVFASCDPIKERGIYYMSFGDNRNLRTGEIVSDKKIEINDWMYTTDKIIGIQSIMFPNFARDFILRSYETVLWDVSDLMFNDMFKYKGKAIAPRLTTQIEGVSTIQGEKIQHFLLKNADNLVKDKNPNDIIVEYNKDDQRFYMCLSDFYQSSIGNISITVNAGDVKNVYTAENRELSPHNPMWIQIYGHHKYGEFSFDFKYKDEFLFTKKIKMDTIPDSEVVKNQIQEVMETIKNVQAEELPDGKDFDLDFKIEENKLYLPYNGSLKDVILNIKVKAIETNENLFSAENIRFNNGGYCNWVTTGKNHYKTDPDFLGFLVEYYRNDKLLFSHNLQLREKKRTDTKEIKNAFVVLTYPNTKIKEEVTEKCLDSIKPSNTKIIMASHYPASKILQEKVDYYLYDAYNPLIQHTFYNQFWTTLPQGKIEIKLDKLQKKTNLNQSLTVLNNIENSVKFAKLAGYDKIICVSYDFIFNENNLNTIKNLCDKIDNQSKKGYFMLYHEGDMTLYKSVFFIVNTEFYTKVFNLQTHTPEQFNSECAKLGSHNFLENYFYKKLLPYNNELIIEETNEEKLFNNPNINLFSGVEYLAIIPVKEQINSFVIWFNSSNNRDNRRIEFTYDNKGKIENTTHFIKERTYYFRKITMIQGDNYTITANFIDSNTNQSIDKQTFNINSENYNDITSNGLFTEIEKKYSLDITYNEDDQKISMWNSGSDFDGKFTILDVDSKVPIYWTPCTVPNNTTRWILPIPKPVFDFNKNEHFNGFDIQLYENNDVFLLNKIILIKKDSEKLDLPYLKWITPFDSLYFIWRDFFIDKIYDDFLSKINIDVTVDLGANQGLFTHLVLTKGSKKVYAIEALKDCCDNLKKMFDDKVIIVNKAISDNNEKKNLYFDKVISTFSHTDMERFKKNPYNTDAVYEKTEVEGITINDLIKEYKIDKINLLKVDIEGDEYLLFKSITEENLSKIDNMLIEYHHNYNNEVDVIINKIKSNFNFEMVKTKQLNGGNILATKK